MTRRVQGNRLLHLRPCYRLQKHMIGCAMYELCKVGNDALVGEVIRIEADKATIQVYEETAGVTVGDPVLRTGKPLSVELGPGLMETIYDGIQRPLKGISDKSNSIYIPRGIDVPALDREKKWDFHSQRGFSRREITSLVETALVSVFENSLLSDHKILLPPRARGTITRMPQKGSYTVDEKILEVEFDGKKTEYSMMHPWPVRVPSSRGGTRRARTSLSLSDSVCSIRCSPVYKGERSAFLVLLGVARRSLAKV